MNMPDMVYSLYEQAWCDMMYSLSEQAWCDINNILSSSQFGFRSGARTEHAQLKFTDDILTCFDDNKVGIATFMDLSKAFDCIDHKILLTKMKRYGIHSTPLRWIRSYLSNREHSISWNHIKSTSLNLNIGVLQRSILGPLLSLIYINGIEN